MSVLYDKVGQTVTVIVDEGLIRGADPANGIGIRAERKVIEVTGTLVFIDAEYIATIDVNNVKVTFDIDDAIELIGPSS